MKKRTYRKWVTCWLKWSVSEDGKSNIVSLYHRKVQIFAIYIQIKKYPKQWIAKSFLAEQAARDWARSKKFEIIKERL